MRRGHRSARRWARGQANPAQAAQEMLTGARRQVQQPCPHVACAGVPSSADHSIDRFHRVREPRQDRRDPDAGVDAGRRQHGDCPQAVARVRGARLGEAPDVLVQRGDRERDAHVRVAGRFLEDIDVTHHERTAADDGEGIARLGQDLQAGTREPKTALRGLIRICGRADGDHLPLPRPARQLTPQDLRDVGLDADGRPVGTVRRPSGPEFERADVAERAAVGAAHVRIE